MEPWLDGVRRILARTPTGTLPFSEILEALSSEGMGQGPDPHWLLEAVAARADLFRVIPLARGPWAYWQEGAGRERSLPGRAQRRDDPWILLLRPPRAGLGRADWVFQRMREGLVAWGRDLDDASPPSVARWLRAAREGTRMWAHLMEARPPNP